ncbi:MAG: hypothetical protein K0S44_1515 [Bacteroidetes bacterium]|jgi:hypothetical protein|nr:hypothetical protein [Bacteroidota bacterium]
MKTNFLLIISSFLLLSSCSNSLYVSNTVNVPLLKEKGEVKVNVDQSNAQVAVAISDHWGVMVNGFYKAIEKKADNFVVQGTLGEAGFGYYKAFRKGFVFETYGGLGLGTIDRKQTYTTADNNVYWASFDAQGTKAFVQPSFGYGGRYFDLAFTPRFSFVKYTHFRAFGYTEEQLAADYLDNDRITKGIFTFAEPAITVRGGYKFIKIQAQYGLTMNLSPRPIKHNPSFASIGLVIDVARWYNKVKTEPGTY